MPSRRKTLAMLGLAATVVYCTPLLTPLGEAHASGALGFFINDKITRKECSECHMAYDPGLMPQGSWRRLMGDLQNHFGEDASLDAQTRDHIETFLVSRALRGDGSVRITEQPWFVREHRTKFTLFGSAPEPDAKNALSNCNRCHAQ